MIGNMIAVGALILVVNIEDVDLKLLKFLSNSFAVS